MDKINEIIKKADVSEEEIKGKKRTLYLNTIRWYIYSQLKEDLSISEIGRMFNRSHATVLHGIKTLNDRIGTDKETQEIVNSIK